jgi:hypothetical protein
LKRWAETWLLWIVQLELAGVLLYKTGGSATWWGVIVPYAVLLADSIWRQKDPKCRLQNFYMALILFLWLGLISPWGLGVIARLTPSTLDSNLRSMDLATHLDGFALARSLARHHLGLTTALAYDALPLAFAVAWVIDRSYDILWTSLIGAALCIPVQFMIPACGPRYAFSNWPWGDVAANPSSYATMPRNCMPSMHVGWALLIALNARGKWARLGFLLFALVTCLATVGSGEHYAIDAVVAVPFAVAVQALYRVCRRQKPRSKKQEVRSRKEATGSGRKIERSGPVSSYCLLPTG